MRIFLTGATGFVGSAIVPELLSAGYRVLALARSDSSGEALAALGADVHRGDLRDLASLRSAAAVSDGVIHAGFDHDFSKFEQNCAIDRRAIEAIGGVLKGSKRPFVVTAGLPVQPGRLAVENDSPPAEKSGTPRLSEQTALALAESGVHASVIRMAQLHDRSRQGFATYLLPIARSTRVSAYIGDGLNRWPAVHRLDAAYLYRLVLEEGRLGARYHAVTEEGTTVRQVAEAIGQGLDVPVVSITPEEADGHFGWLARIVAMDAPASSASTQSWLGWRRSAESGFITDLEQSIAVAAV